LVASKDRPKDSLNSPGLRGKSRRSKGSFKGIRDECTYVLLPFEVSLKPANAPVEDARLDDEPAVNANKRKMFLVPIRTSSAGFRPFAVILSRIASAV
jgi:hypothetical protein